MKKFLTRVRQAGSPGTVLGVVALCVALGGTAIAANTINSSDVINNSLKGIDVKNKSLTRKDFRGSIRGAPGPAGARGATGATGATGAAGATGPAGPTASGFATADPPDAAVGAATDLISTTVTVTATSRIVATATLTVGATGGDSDIECVIEINDSPVGAPVKERHADAFEVVTLTSAGTVGPGTHDVEVECNDPGLAGSPVFNSGNLTAIAVAQ